MLMLKMVTFAQLRAMCYTVHGLLWLKAVNVIAAIAELMFLLKTHTPTDMYENGLFTNKFMNQINTSTGFQTLVTHVAIT